MLMSTSTVARSCITYLPLAATVCLRHFEGPGLLPAVPLFVNAVNLAGFVPCRGRTRPTFCWLAGTRSQGPLCTGWTIWQPRTR